MLINPRPISNGMIKLVSLNIERSKHLDLVLPFLEKEAADVVCLQELAKKDIPKFEDALGGKCFFAGMANHGDGEGEVAPGIVGIGMFSKLPVAQQDARYYWGTGVCEVLYDFSSAAGKHATESYVVVYQDVEKNGERYRVATTHFTWTPDGEADDLQRQDLRSLFHVLEPLGELALCGDFNAPRGGEIFGELAKRYKDNIPPENKTSLDLSFHRAGKTEAERLGAYMVDGLFTSPGYLVSDVRLQFGVSDHAAVIATIAREGERG